MKQRVFLFVLFPAGPAGATTILADWMWKMFRERNKKEYGTCGECFCIPGVSGECPVELQPNTQHAELIPVLQRFIHLNPYQLDCDPYLEGCETMPEPIETTGVACVAEFFAPAEMAQSCPRQWVYRLATWGTPGNTTLEEIMNDKQTQHQHALITHRGPCGTCSSLQDLSVYMEQGADLQTTATVCASVTAVSSKEVGIRCFESMGFTRACAATWYYNSRYTQKNCQDICLRSVLGKEEHVGPPPTCKLNACLECDETKAGPVFQATAGRTRRNSGLRSGITRTCEEMSLAIVPRSPCNGTIVPRPI